MWVDPLYNILFESWKKMHLGQSYEFLKNISISFVFIWLTFLKVTLTKNVKISFFFLSAPYLRNYKW